MTRPAQGTPAQNKLVRRGLALAWFIIVWDVVEGIVAVTAGLAVGSIALVGFGIDSAIEVFAASVVIWQLRAGAHARQRPALRAIAVTFYALAAFVGFESIRDLVTQDKAGESLIGIVLNVVALLVMVPVAVAQRRIGRELNNPVLTAQSTETWMSNALSVTVLAGLGLNATLGWWWADPVVALAVAGLAVQSGREAWHEAGKPTPAEDHPSTTKDQP
ncbi:Cation efflux family protein [Promicromonospora umidemergens]|uniref:Cation transporter n=1 Tax=Promicromonospora umidemergens TaxID=629679 RepID=A0ABP8Y395_9MICO|nr:Cation efflux family protein [Promicromonospora umidemergens]